MRQIVALAVVGLVSLVVLLPRPAFAQGGEDEPAKKIGVGGDLVFVIPVGTLATASGPLLGPVLRVGYRITPRLEVTGRAGYLFGFGTNRGGGSSSSVSFIPIWAGARYFVMHPDAGLYAAGELGLNLSQLHLDPDPGSAADDAKKLRARVGFNLGVGYVISKALPLDFRVQFMHFNLLGTETGDKPFLGVGLSAGYTFQL